MVYYLKYRPQTISDLDSTKLRETLYSVLRPVAVEQSGSTLVKQANSSFQSSVPHAFLFTGPKGLGKTSTARIVAKVVNCLHTGDSSQSSKSSKEENRSIEPDNTCTQCVSITNGTNMDVLEIDGASNRGIDEIRDLRERVRLAPSAAHKKVYIIDEVHMLTTEAFNALLKTVEEPPSHVVFIFCTTEPQKVPDTILSRCFHISFATATEDEIVHSLERIVQGEKISISTDALKKIAHLSDGGFRDGAKLLEEVVALSRDKKITVEIVEDTLHISGLSSYITSLLEALAEKNAQKGIAVLSEVVQQGGDMKFFLQEVLQTLHILLLAKVGVRKETSTLLEKFSLEEIEQLLSLFSDSIQQIKYAAIAQLPLELIVIGWARQNKVDVIIQNNNTQPTIETLIRKEKNLKVHNLLYPKDQKPKKIKEDADQPEITSHSNTSETLMENIIYKVKSINASVAGVLRGCVILTVSDKEIIFETAYKFHKERLEEAKTYAIIEKVIREVTGKPLQVRVQLKKS